MVLYRCQNCPYKSNHKGNYIKHLNKKKKCYNENIKPIYDVIKKNNENAPKCTKQSANNIQNITNEKEIYSCEICAKEFSRKSSLIRHSSTRCKSESINNLNNEILNNIITKLSDMSTEHQQQREAWNCERNEYRKIISDLSKENTKTINQTFNQTNQIIINNHGEEDLKYITAEYLTELLKIPYNSVPQLVKQIHFHPEHPENHNLKITNKKLPYIQVYMDKQWQVKDKKQIIDSIVDKSIGILDEHFDEQDKLNDSQKERYITFTQTKDDKDLNKKILKETELCVINNSETLTIENN